MSICPRCGVSFECGVVDRPDTAETASAPCWCASLPPLPTSSYVPDKYDPRVTRCLCAYCLRALLAASHVSGP